MDVRLQFHKELVSLLTADDVDIAHLQLDRPHDAQHGDYTTNIALIVAKEQGKSPREYAELLKEKLLTKNLSYIQDITVAGPGFLNFTLTKDVLVTNLHALLSGKKKLAKSTLSEKKLMVEYAHPNTHKEMHIGHMRTLITGEAIARLLEAVGASVFRANYQGDIGPHVAKAIYGITQLMEERTLTISEITKWRSTDKAHFLGEGYVRGNTDYEEQKEEIDALNSKLYIKDRDIWPLYEETRQWSLDYYDAFYSRFGTKFDQLFFESEMADKGKDIVKKHLGKVFTEDNGAVIFPGEQYGLHTRVFITKVGNPTYEGKEMANAFAEYEAFPFDQKIHIVASEQAGYFQVVFKALELIDPEKFKDKQKHLSMGMVQLSGPTTHKASSGQVRKMSSRTGDVLTVDWLLDQVKEKVMGLLQEGRIESEDKEKVAEQITIGAVKYSVLKVSATQNVSFDIEKSVSLDGDSGPYLQYTYARTQSLLRKAGNEESMPELGKNVLSQPEEMMLLRLLAQFDDIVVDAAEKLSPSTLATYLFDLSQTFNLFYQKLPILKESDEIKNARLALTAGVGKTLKNGLNLLGIDAPERM